MECRENLSDNALRTARLFLSASGVDTHLMSDIEVAMEARKRMKTGKSDEEQTEAVIC